MTQSRRRWVWASGLAISIAGARHSLRPLSMTGCVDGGAVDVLTDGYAYGSLSMTSYTLGLEDR